MENLPLQSQYLPLGATRIREIKSITAKIGESHSQPVSGN
ncbi:hypothetical protein E2C01_079502 [Portunus trituberculatus]|uniref:Uncharacterized protein n=1 Tax=Portunus trituberculatus TaxID=210409 RepID=A0A5B7IQS7_PORTR|nr:hypothetical protein [Portunus trituberculatus]